MLGPDAGSPPGLRVRTARPMDTRLLILLGIVIGVVFLATVVLLYVRKRILSPEATRSSGLLMEDFRRLHAAGQLSDEEFQALRSRVASRMKATLPAKGSLHAEPEGRAGAPQAQRAQRPAPRKTPPTE